MKLAEGECLVVVTQHHGNISTKKVQIMQLKKNDQDWAERNPEAAKELKKLNKKMDGLRKREASLNEKLLIMGVQIRQRRMRMDIRTGM